MTAELTNGDRLRFTLSNIEELVNSNLNGELTLSPIGSRLDEDVAMVASVGLATAIDCLALFVDLAKTERFNIRPFAHLPVIRTAMLGACQAVWVLGGTEHEQLSRAVAVRIESLKYDIGYSKTLESAEHLALQIADDGPEQLRAEIELLQGRASELIDWSKAKGLKASAEATQMHLVAAQLCWEGNDHESIEKRAYLMAQWRIASSVAHAREWSLQRRGDGLQLLGDRPAASFAPSPEELSNGLFLTLEMCQAGLRLWRDRNQSV